MRQKVLCKVPGCERAKESFNLCVLHYRRFKTHGSFEPPNVKKKNETLAAIEELLKSVQNRKPSK